MAAIEDSLGRELDIDRDPRIGFILSYHRIAGPELDPWGLRVSPENFSQQLAALRRFGTPTTLSDAVASYESETRPKTAIILTFDDGYVDNLTRALPRLKEFDVPATFFISTGYTGRPYFWWEALEQIFLRPNTLPDKLTLSFQGCARRLYLGEAARYTREEYEIDCISCAWRGEPGSRVRVYHEVYDALWPLNHRIRLNIVEEITSWAGVDPASFGDARPMTRDEIVQLGCEELITVGAHSVNHLPLAEQSPHLQEAEILGSRTDLERILARPVNQFAYPHGKYCAESIRILKNSGFLGACTTEEGHITTTTDPMLLPRLAVDDWTGEEFSARLAKEVSAYGP